MLERIIAISTALLTPLLAIIVTYIAILQWRLESQKWRLSLYEKRFQTFQIVTQFISLICLNGKCTTSELTLFLQEASRHRFLFGDEIQEYVMAVYNRALELKHTENATNETSGDYRKILAKEEQKQFEWFPEQFTIAEIKFGEYLKIQSR